MQSSTTANARTMIGVGGRSVKMARHADSRLLKKALIDRGWSVTELAWRTGFSRNYVSLLIHGRMRYEPGQRVIARKLRLGLEEAFPRDKG